jgi:TonB family protein
VTPRTLGVQLLGCAAMPPETDVREDSSWRVPVHLPPEVLSRLGMEALQAFKAIPRRGLEVGGLLLGTRDAEGIHIHSIVPIESEHRWGPSYKLSETDRKELDAALGNHSDAVGLYRSHTRSKDLRLEEDDIALFERRFNTPEHVFVLVQPATRAVEIFFPVAGPAGQVSVAAGPFSVAAGRLDVATEGLPAAATTETPAVVAHGPTPPRFKIPWRRLASSSALVAAAALFAGGLGGFVVYRWVKPELTRNLAPPPTDHLDLFVRRDGPALRLQWNRNAPALRDASHGTLYITDGKLQSKLNLITSELATAALTYWPQSQDVTFRLEVARPEGNLVGSVRALGPESESKIEPKPSPFTSPSPEATVPPRASPRGEAARAALPPVRTKPARMPETKPRPPAEAVRPPGPIAVQEASRQEPVPVKQPQWTSPAKPSREPARVVPALPARAENPEVSVVAEPVTHSGFLRKIPLLRRLKKRSQTFVPPKVVHQERPALNAREQRSVTRRVPVDVKVYVNKAGNVEFAELMSDTGRGRMELDAAAVYAARRWKFSPARMGDEEVPGEVVLHFVFAPPAEAAVRH